LNKKINTDVDRADSNQTDLILPTISVFLLILKRQLLRLFTAIIGVDKQPVKIS